MAKISPINIEVYYTTNIMWLMYRYYRWLSHIGFISILPGIGLIEDNDIPNMAYKIQSILNITVFESKV